MYWSRAKNILILMLLGLNIFLAVNLIVYNSDRGAAAEAEANADVILRTRNIQISCKVPKLGGTVTRLNFISDGFDRTILIEKLTGITIGQSSGIETSSVLENGSKRLEFISGIEFLYTDTNPQETVDISKDITAEKYASDFLRSRKLLSKSYVVDGFKKNDDKSVTIRFIEKSGGKLIFDNYLDVTMTSKGIIKIAGSHRSIKKAGRSGNYSIMTARQILLKNFTGSSKMVIESIDVGYKANNLSEHNIKASSEDPVIRIKIKDEAAPRFYYVFNGVEIK